MKKIFTYKDFINEQETIDKNAGSDSNLLSAYTKDDQVRNNVNQAIQSNSNYNTLFNAIKNYWTNQISSIKNKPIDTLTGEESKIMDVIQSKFKTGDPKDIENYTIQKIIAEHSKEIDYDPSQKKISIKSYTETPYDTEMKNK